MLENKAVEYVKSHGAKDIRHYFIEGTDSLDGGHKIEIRLGT